jgi:hypothetical protein
VSAINLHIDQPVLTVLSGTIKVVTDCVGARSFLGGFQELVSGAAAWKNPISETVPNFVRVTSKAFLLASNVAKTTGWLIQQRVINPDVIVSAAADIAGKLGIAQLANVAAKVGLTPVFAAMGNITLSQFQSVTSGIGISIDLIDIARDVAVNGVTINTWIAVTGDVAKIAVIVLAGSTAYAFVLLGLVAAATASTTALVKFACSAP